MDIAQSIGAFFQQNQATLFLLVRALCAVAIVALCLITIFLVLLLPVRIQAGIIRLDGLIKLIVGISILAWMVAAVTVVTRLEFIVIAKLCILNSLIIGSMLCWLIILAGPGINRALTQIQQECELATNLTFLQAEMARAQLDALHQRIQRSIEPEEREITETMLKTISPLISLFLRKERSVMKWSVAAVDAGKMLMTYFWSPKR